MTRHVAERPLLSNSNNRKKDRKVGTKTFTSEESFSRMCCSECGVVYFYPEKWTDGARAKGKSWTCPNGHSQWFGEGENDKLRRERDRLKQQIAEMDDTKLAADRKIEALQADAVRHAKRAKAGTCPCCKRTFKQLAAHMKTKHPTYATDN